MKATFKLISFGIASLTLLIIAYYFLRSFFDVLNSGMEVRIPHLGMLFQSYKLVFILANIVGIILCVFLLIKNSRRFFKAVLVLISFDLFYSISSFLWVAVAHKLLKQPEEQFFAYFLDVFSGSLNERLIEDLGIMASTKYIRFLYLINFYNMLIMSVLAAIFLYLKRIVDKRVKRIQEKSN